MYNKMLSIIIVIAFTILLISNVIYGQNELQLKPMFPEAGKVTIYELKFNPPDSLDAKAQLKIVFPKVFDLSKVKMAGSSTINGGFQVDVVDSTVILKRTGLGQTLLPGEKVDVKFANVVNPLTPDEMYEVKVEIWNNNQKLIDKSIDVKILAEKAK